MAEEKKYTLLYKEIGRDVNDELHDMQLLRQRLRENERPPYVEEEKCAKFKTEKVGTHRGINVQLPSGIDFRIEQGQIIVSDFGMDKKQLQELIQFCEKYGIEGIKLPTIEDEEFKKVATEVLDEMETEGHQMGGFSDEEEDENTPAPEQANDNTPPLDTTGMSDEEILEAKRKLTQDISEAARIKREAKSDKKTPSVDAIRKYMEDHVNFNQRYKTNTHKITSTSNGWKMLVYKDSEQKHDGPKEDKDGHVNQNFQFGIIGEIIPDDKGNPRLSMTFLTPKYGDMEGWMWEEVMSMAKENGITHIKYNAGMQYKGKFFEACGKKLRVPTGLSMKYKDWKAVIDAAKANNDDLGDRSGFYKMVAKQIKKGLKKDNITDEGNQLFELIQDLEDSARNEGVINSSKIKFKRFNQYFENNLMDKFYNDDDNKMTAEPDATKEIASAHAFARFVAEFKKDDNRVYNMDEEQKNKLFRQFYNEEVCLVDKKLSVLLDDMMDSKDPRTIETRNNLLEKEYKKADQIIKKTRANIKQDLGVDIDTPTLQNSEYTPSANINRVGKGQLIVDAKEKEKEEKKKEEKKKTPSIPAPTRDGR